MTTFSLPVSNDDLQNVSTELERKPTPEKKPKDELMDDLLETTLTQSSRPAKREKKKLNSYEQ